MRISHIVRNTRETAIELTLNIDGEGKRSINTDCGFFNHMLELFAAHSRFDIDVTCKGDSHVDYHHTVEDSGIVLGQALTNALGDTRSINCYGSFLLPMDEALVMVALDISARPYLDYGLDLDERVVGDFDAELGEEFFAAFTREAGLTLHIRQLAGRNTHHLLEAAFKGVARALKEAVAIDEKLNGELPSTKGVL